MAVPMMMTTSATGQRYMTDRGEKPDVKGSTGFLRMLSRLLRELINVVLQLQTRDRRFHGLAVLAPCPSQAWRWRVAKCNRTFS